MHGFDDTPSSVVEDPTDNRPWYRTLTSYHWFVLVVSALGWLFDCLDQQLFILARPAAMAELIKSADLSPEALKQSRGFWGDVSTAVFIAGWATGGLFFGMLGDRIGRAKTMMITILIYSLCTGLSAFSQTVFDFAFYRFLTGLGVGGEFAVGVALVAEVMPHRARPYALAMLQALSAIGNIGAAFINLGLGIAEEEGMVTSPWRIMFLVGALPAFLALVIRGRLKEPERWTAMSHEDLAQKQLGSYQQLFGHPLWCKHALLGLMLACSGVIGLWAVGFFTPDLTKFVLRKGMVLQACDEQMAVAQTKGDTARLGQLEQFRKLEAEASSAGAKVPAELEEVKLDVEKVSEGRLKRWQSYSSIMLNLGAFLGMFGFGAVAQRLGRKPTFVLALLAAFTSTISVFLFLQSFWQVLVLVPLMGFCQLSLFSGYAIYFPELFPTRLRSTGTSFCYNVGRYVAAVGLFFMAYLKTEVFGATDEPLRYAGATMCAVFLIGLVALPFLPETRNKPLPE